MKIKSILVNFFIVVSIILLFFIYIDSYKYDDLFQTIIGSLVFIFGLTLLSINIVNEYKILGSKHLNYHNKYVIEHKRTYKYLFFKYHKTYTYDIYYLNNHNSNNDVYYYYDNHKIVNKEISNFIKDYENLN